VYPAVLASIEAVTIRPVRTISRKGPAPTSRLDASVKELQRPTRSGVGDEDRESSEAIRRAPSLKPRDEDMVHAP
jgi:hypothetical protein